MWTAVRDGRLPALAFGLLHSVGMRGKATFLGHSVHPMLIVFPLALLVLTPASDLVGLITKDSFWSRAAFWLAFLGVIAGVVAAIPGFIDWLAVPRRTRARRVGVIHLAVNLTAIGLFVLSVVLRLQHGAARFGVVPFILAIAGAGVILVGGWFGGELVQRLTVGVWSDAHLDAPSSLDAARLTRREPTPSLPPRPIGRPTEPRPV